MCFRGSMAKAHFRLDIIRFFYLQRPSLSKRGSRETDRHTEGLTHNNNQSTLVGEQSEIVRPFQETKCFMNQASHTQTHQISVPKYCSCSIKYPSELGRN